MLMSPFGTQEAPCGYFHLYSIINYAKSQLKFKTKCSYIRLITFANNRLGFRSIMQAIIALPLRRNIYLSLQF